MNKINKKGFTIIELLITIAVLSILVLIGVPRLLGYIEKAELTRIQHDVKVMEQEVQSEILDKSFNAKFNGWQNNEKKLGSLILKGKLFEKEGVSKSIDASHLARNGVFNLNKYNGQLASESQMSYEYQNGDLGVGGETYLLDDFSVDKTYKILPGEYSDKIKTKLNGTFYTNSEGKVYYEHDKPLTSDESSYANCPLPYPESDYEFEIKNDKGTIVKWHGDETHIVIPEAFKITVDGDEKCVPVQVIGSGAFMRGGFKSIVIPQSVRIIEENAFRENQLSEVTIPHSVEYIGQQAFDENIVNNDGTTSLKVTVNRKEGSVEYGQGGRHFGDSEPTYRIPTPKDLGVIFYPETGAIIANTANSRVITIPEYLHVGGVDYPVKQISKGAYQGVGLISAILPESLEKIEDYAFSGNQLEGITIPDKVNHIGNYAFAFNEAQHSTTGKTIGTIKFINLKGEDRFKDVNKYGDIADNTGKKIENIDGVNMLDHIFVLSNGNYVITEEYVGENVIADDGEAENDNGGDSSSNESVAIREPNVDEIPIYTAEDLNNIRNKQSAKYILMSDIDLSSYSNWAPIGRSTYSSRAGSIDGNGFKIRNLTINSNGEKIGLFGNVSSLVVRNLALEDVNIKGKRYVGAIAGDLSNGTIVNSYVTGTVSGKDAGMLTGRTYNSTRVTNSYAIGTISGDSYSKGGLFGDFYNRSKVVNSYAAVKVVGSGGGIAYKINKSSGASASGVYWDTEVSGKASPTYSGTAAGAFGRTTENMRKEDSFAGWDFKNVWQINEGESYPYLRANPQYPAPGLN